MTTAIHNKAAIIEAFKEGYGFDPRGIYCQVTGKLIGRVYPGEFNDLIETIGRTQDADEAADELATRIIGSMRPSPKWNKFRAESLVEMRQRYPVETLSYLVNRMFAPRDWRRMGVAQMYGFYLDRIQGYLLLEQWGVTDPTNTLLYMLLEIDAKWNLDTESPPFNARDFFFDCPTMEHRVELVQRWYERRMADWAKKVKAEELQVAWTRSGNALARPAWTAEFMAAKPLSESGKKKAAKDEEKKFMAGLLSQIMMGKVESVEEGEAIQPKPTFVPIRRMPMQFGVK